MFDKKPVTINEDSHPNVLYGAEGHPFPPVEPVTPDNQTTSPADNSNLSNAAMNTKTPVKKKKLVIIISAVLLLGVAGLATYILTKNTGLFGLSTQEEDGVEKYSLFSENGIYFQTISIGAATENRLIRIEMTNRNNKKIDFDLSRLYLARDDGTKVQPIPETTIHFEPNQEFIEWMFPFTMDGINPDDEITVYLDDKKVATVIADNY